MNLSGWPLFFKRLITHIGFTFLRIIFTTPQNLLWRLNGTASRVRESRLPENYHRCVHVLDVLLFHKFDLLSAIGITVKDFLLLHNRFESPSFAFENDHVSLITIDGEKAVFGVAPRSGMHLWRFEYSAFIKHAQTSLCNQLLVVPLNHFHRMAEELGDPKRTLVFLFNTGRCGSTLLTQMIQTTGKCVSISEPDALNVLAFRYRTRGDSEQLRELTRDVVRWICRPYRDFDPLAYMMKITCLYIYGAPLFIDVFPDAKYLFMYRDIIKVSQSYFKLLQKGPFVLFVNAIAKKSLLNSTKILSAVGLPGQSLKFWDDMSIGFCLFTASCKKYMELRRKGFNVFAIRYEDVVHNRRFAARAILNFCQLPDSLEEDFLEGLKVDSQNNSVLAAKDLPSRRHPELSPESRQNANDLLVKNGLSIIEGNWLLEGTITSKGSTNGTL